MTKIYVGCAISDAPEEFVEEVAKLKSMLEKGGYEILHFVGTWGVVDDSEIFIHDTNCVRECDVLLAICDYPSTGLGMEIMLALELDKKVIAIAESGRRISRMVTGVRHPHFSFYRYGLLENVHALLPAP